MGKFMSILVAFVGVLVLCVLIQAQDQSGFISIDCGAPKDVSYIASTGINYISDANFTNTGVSGMIVSELRTNRQKQLLRLRSFPEGKRNCYKINITKGSKYLIRVGFLYGNYDGQNILPQFDLLLGANLWDTVTINNASLDQFNEIIYVPPLDYVQICLVDTSNGTPFISYIEVRSLNNDTYVTESGSLEYYWRCDLGSNNSYRYNYDVYDRFWYACNIYGDWTKDNVLKTDDSIVQNKYHPAAVVMSTTVTPANASAPLIISWEPKDPTWQFYAYLHFMEIQVLTKNQTREFNIIRNGELRHENLSPRYLQVVTVWSVSAFSGKEIKYSLEMTQNSTLPPIINAFEIYKVKEFSQLDTFQVDVDVITTIKSVYGLTSDWQGDPCSPTDYLWDGLNCTYPRNDSPRITTLNLSSSGLSGKIDPSISNLIMLEKLDLSNNSLNGEIPEFLAQLQHLKVLHLDKNNLSGTIPLALRKGSLSLSVDQNPYLCKSSQCNKIETPKENRSKKKNNTVIVLVASISGIMIIMMVMAAILWTLKRKRSNKALVVESDQSQISSQYTTNQEYSLMQSKKQIYSYSDILKITNNFNKVIGKGGFGTVYLGYINDTPVAVKMLSPSCVHGYQQFQVEVKLLMRVHHKSLTSLVGYCNEGNNKCLIYEYMANGNLQEHLSGKHSKTKFFSWEDRLHIAMDAASGLEYLQNGCKPPIIHRDIKSTNILLNEHFQAKLSDFGLSKIIPSDGETHVSTVIAGTHGYLDPEYYTTNRLTEKSDVYSFGVVLLEIITSQPVIIKNQENTHISQWVNSLVEKGDIKAIIDPRLEGDFDNNSVWKTVEIAMTCVSPSPNKRPTISMIVIELKESLAMELARIKYRGTYTRDSINPTTINLKSDFIPQVR